MESPIGDGLIYPAETTATLHPQCRGSCTRNLVTCTRMVLVDKAEAARRLGVSVDTVERRLKRGDLQGQQEKRGAGWRWLVEVPDDVAPATAPAAAPANNGAAPADAPADAPAENTLLIALQGQIASLQEQLRVMNQALSSRDKENLELVTVIRQQQMLPAPATERKSWWRRFW